MIVTEHLVTWNVGSTKNLVKELLRLVRDLNPPEIALQEVADRRPALIEFCALSGYRLVQFTDGDHSSSLATLIRGDVTEHGKPGIDMLSPRTFVGRLVAGARKDGYTKAKWLLYTRPQFLGYSWIHGNTHLVPSHHIKRARNLAASQVVKIAAWVVSRPRMVLLSGDFNGVPSDRWGVLDPLFRVLDLFTARSRRRRAIDHWWLDLDLLNRRDIVVGKAVALDGYGSDHRPVVVPLTRDIPDPVVEPHACPVCGLMHLPPED